MKYSVLSCLFSNYDLLREVINPDPDVEYIMVTDDPNLKSDTWTIIYSDILMKYPEGPDRWAYVRYHPFEFVNTDAVVYIDGSVQIKDNFSDQFIERFLNTKFEYAVLNNTICDTVTVEVNRWAHYGYYGYTQEDAQRVDKFLNDNKYDLQGLVQSTIIFQKNTKLTHMINNHTWDIMWLWGSNGNVDRINQTALSYVINTIAWHDERVTILSPAMLFCKFLEYNYHNTDISQRDAFVGGGLVYVPDNNETLLNWIFNFQGRGVQPIVFDVV